MVGKKKCGTIRFLNDVTMYPISCKGVQGSEVKIVKYNKILALTEVHVIGTGGSSDIFAAGSGNVQLLSENKPASQSSTMHNAHAERAVDGRVEGHWNRQ